MGDYVACGATGRVGRCIHHNVRLQRKKVRKPKLAARILGAHVTFAKGRGKGTHHQRVEKAVTRADRLQWAPAAADHKARLLATSPTALGLYGLETAEVPKHLLTKWRSAATRAAFGGKRKMKCPELGASV